MRFKEEFRRVSDLIKRKNRILLASHERPDGDALGSMTAMFSVIKELEDKEVVMFSKDVPPDHLKFLPYSDNIVRDLSRVSVNDERVFSPELVLAFDYGDFKRLGLEDRWIKDAAIVTFDHHPVFKQKGDVVIVDPSRSSTCEIVYHFFCAENYKIFPTTATSLLTGIFTDTGGFAHVNTSKVTLQAAGDLLRYGTSIKSLHRHTFSGKSREALKTWGRVLTNILREEDVGMAYSALSFREFKELGASLENFEGLVNILNTPPDVGFSLMLIEYKPGVIKGSLRSEPFKNVDVSKIARALGGGGHKYAAGFEVNGQPLQDVVKYVKRAAVEVR